MARHPGRRVLLAVTSSTLHDHSEGPRQRRPASRRRPGERLLNVHRLIAAQHAGPLRGDTSQSVPRWLILRPPGRRHLVPEVPIRSRRAGTVVLDLPYPVAQSRRQHRPDLVVRQGRAPGCRPDWSSARMSHPRHRRVRRSDSAPRREEGLPPMGPNDRSPAIRSTSSRITIEGCRTRARPQACPIRESA